MAIKTRNLCLGYGGEYVVRNVDLDIPRGSFCCIIGPNGCGKSTLLKALSRNLKARRGSIAINGRDIGTYRTRDLARRVAFLAQSPHVPEQFSVRELVSYGRYPHNGWLKMPGKHDSTVVDRALELTETACFAEKELHHLSGGERQRVWLAMALAQEAEILLLDEPTTYLDIAHQFQTLELVGKLHREMNRTVLMVLHDLNQAARYAERLLVMREGELIAAGKPGEIMREELLRDVFRLETKVFFDEENNCPHFIPLRGLACLPN